MRRVWLGLARLMGDSAIDPATSWDNTSGEGTWGNPLNWVGNVRLTSSDNVFVGNVVSSLVSLNLPGATSILCLSVTNGAALNRY